MKPEDVLLTGVVLLAVLFFVGGVIDVFRPSLSSHGRRRRREADRPELTELLEEWLVEVESLHRRRGASLNDAPSTPKPLAPLATPTPQMPEKPKPVVEPLCPVVAGAAVASVTPEVARPARPQTATVLRHATAAFPKSDGNGATDRRSDVEPSPPDQLESIKIVAHYANGKIIKGYTYDFYAYKPHFHLLPRVAGFSFTDEVIAVRIKDLKAVFFVRDFDGNPSYNEQKEFPVGERRPGRKVEVRFKDGEVLVGSTVGYDAQRPGFFFIPADPKSNNLKVFAVVAAVTKVRFL